MHSLVPIVSRLSLSLASETIDTILVSGTLVSEILYLMYIW